MIIICIINNIIVIALPMFTIISQCTYTKTLTVMIVVLLCVCVYQITKMISLVKIITNVYAFHQSRTDNNETEYRTYSHIHGLT